MISKAEARKLAKARLAAMSEEDREWASGSICDALSGIFEFTSAKKPFVFLGSDLEPDTEEIIGLAMMLEREVSVPRVVGNDMQAVRVTPYSNFRRNKWGILEPVGGGIQFDVDVAIVPALAFDGLKRVGHGGGYYDRFLAGRDCFKIGVAFDCQRIDGVEFEPFDVQMDMVVTDKYIIDGDGIRQNVYGVEK